MPAISRLSGTDPTNLLVIGRPGLPDVAHPRAAYTAWRAANPTAPPAQAEAQILAAPAPASPNPPVQVRGYAFVLTWPDVGVLGANLRWPIPPTWGGVP